MMNEKYRSSLKNMKNTEKTSGFLSGVTQHLSHSFGQPKCDCRQVKFPKYVCLVTRLGEQLLEKQILTFVLDIL